LTLRSYGDAKRGLRAAFAVVVPSSTEDYPGMLRSRSDEVRWRASAVPASSARPTGTINITTVCVKPKYVHQDVLEDAPTCQYFTRK
jgi:hypothetical protein